jgi:integrase/recombinase XerD
MSTAKLAAVSFLARYSARTHHLSFQLREWFAWCERNSLDPLVGAQRAHVELYIRSRGERGLMDSSVVSMMNGVRGYFRFAHIDGLIPADPAVYARLPKVQRDESRTQGLDRLELIRFLQVAQTITIHHGALAYLLGINALRASEAAAVRIEDYAESLRGHRVLRLVGKGNKPATMPITVPVLRVLGACRGEDQRPADPAATVRPTDRPARRLPDGHQDRQGGRHPATHQPPLLAARRHHQRAGCRGAPSRRPDPRPPRRPQDHRALRPGPRQPRPARRALPHRLRRRCLSGPHSPRRKGVPTKLLVPRWYHVLMAMNLRLTDTESEALRVKAEQEGRSMQEVARTAIAQYVSERPQRLLQAIQRVRTEDDELLRRLSK